MDIQIHSLHFDADAKLIEFINEKVKKLETFFDNIIACEVILRIEKNDENENKVSEVKLFVPGKDLFAKKQCKSFEEATDSAVEAIRKQVMKSKAKAAAI